MGENSTQSWTVAEDITRCVERKASALCFQVGKQATAVLISSCALAHLPLSLAVLRQIPAYVLVLLFVRVARSGATRREWAEKQVEGPHYKSRNGLVWLNTLMSAVLFHLLLQKQRRKIFIYFFPVQTKFKLFWICPFLSLFFSLVAEDNLHIILFAFLHPAWPRISKWPHLSFVPRQETRNDHLNVTTAI